MLAMSVVYTVTLMFTPTKRQPLISISVDLDSGLTITSYSKSIIVVENIIIIDLNGMKLGSAALMYSALQ